LFGTRNGCILEAAFSFEYSGVKVQSNEGTDKLKKNENKNDEDSNEELDDDNSENEDNASYLNVFQKKKNFTDKINSFKFSYNLYLRSHCSQILNSQNQKNYTNKKIHIALHPFFPIMVSCGEDNVLYIWDTDKNQILNCKEYKNKPTAIKFSPDGNLLVIGFINGTLLILDSKIDKSIHGKISESKRKYQS